MLEKIIKASLDFYLPNFRFIETITPHYPETTGTFIIPKRQYMVEDCEILSGACSIILVTQAIIISVVDNVYHKRIPELEHIDLTSEDDINKFCHQLVISSLSIKFRKIIWIDEPEKTFQLTIANVKSKLNNKVVFFNLGASVSNGKHSGSAIGTYIRNDYDSPYKK
jgi:hypothetical protein